MIRTTILPLSMSIALAGAASAQDVFTKGVQISDTSATDADLYVEDKTVLDANLCVGSGCSLTEGYTDELVRLKQANANILFEDTSPPSGGFPSNDWRIKINENTQNGMDLFGIEDVTGGTLPFVIEAGAPSNGLYLNGSGLLGLGTGLPTADIHVVDGSLPTIRLEQDGSEGNPQMEWSITAGGTMGFQIRDVQPLNYGAPFTITPNNPNRTILALAGGFAGIGTLYPGAMLHVDTDVSSEMGLLVEDLNGPSPPPEAFVHVRSDKGKASVFVEETSATANPRTLVNLQNNGRPEIVMGNTAKGREWSLGAGASFFLKTGAVGSASGAKTKVFTVKGNGDAILAGTLTTGGTTCGGGCDAVFSDDYNLPTIADHAEAMYALGHLPNVGPTIENAPINVSDKLGRMLNELEHAHIYIAELERENRQLKARDRHAEAEIEALRGAQVAMLGRLEALESGREH